MEKAYYDVLPLWQLDRYYRNMYDIVEITKRVKNHVFSDPDRGTLWTSTFTCPVTQRVFRSDLFHPHFLQHMEQRTNNMQQQQQQKGSAKGGGGVGGGDVLVGADRALEVSSIKAVAAAGSTNQSVLPQQHEKTVCYPKKSAAANAVAAQALDTWRWEKEGLREPRFCLSDPAGETVTKGEDDDGMLTLLKLQQEQLPITPKVAEPLVASPAAAKANNTKQPPPQPEEDADAAESSRQTTKGKTSGDEENAESLSSSSLPPRPPRALLRNHPLSELDNYYRVEHNFQKRTSSLMRTTRGMAAEVATSNSATDNKTSAATNSTVWTAVFTCPVTNQVFASGVIKPEIASVLWQSKASNGSDAPRQHVIQELERSSNTKDGETEQIFHVVYYPSKSRAINAAAARALDYFRYEADQALEPRLCEDDPRDKNNNKDAQLASLLSSPSPLNAMEEIAPHAAASLSSEEEEEKKKEEASHASVKVALYDLSPTVDLDAYYRKELNNHEHQLSLLMETEMVSRRGLGQVWTAQYTCPISGRVFQSGRVRSERRMTNKEKDGYYEITLEGTAKREQIFYRRKNMAIQAAAARALDTIRFEKDGSLEPRICEEDPLDDGKSSMAELDKEEEAPDADDNIEDEESMEMMMADEESDKMLMDLDEEILGVPTEPITPTVPAAEGLVPLSPLPEVSDFAWEQVVADEGSEELFVYELPTQSDGPEMDREERTSPALRILSSLVGSFGSTLPNKSLSLVRVMPADETSAETAQTPMSEIDAAMFTGSMWVQSEVDRIRRVENEANIWVESVSNRKASPGIHGIDLPQRASTSALYIAKSLLASLAEANLSCTSKIFSSSTEGPASKILNFLWNAEEVAPDTDTLNLYLQCLEGPDPLTRALKAESVVERMKNQTRLRGNVPPKPNMGTYNALLHIWAQVGGGSGRYSKLDESFRPNRDSFVAILSSSSYVDSKKRQESIFDLEFAKQCVRRMSNLHTELEDESLKPDTQIFNAPMRWSGGLLWRESRPSTRRIAWDNHRRIFSPGFKPFSWTDPLVRNAVNIEKWFHFMDEYGVLPNIETYEAVAQAWVRTGTREGLEKAEALIRGIPASSDTATIRIQTLHPIIAAWLHVKDKESAAKILEWIEFLRSRNETTRDALEMDLRFLCLEIATHLLMQDNLLRSSNTLPNETSAESASETPRKTLVEQNSAEESNLKAAEGIAEESSGVSEQPSDETGAESTEISVSDQTPSGASEDDTATAKFSELLEKPSDETVTRSIGEEASQTSVELDPIVTAETLVATVYDPLELPNRCSHLFNELARQIKDAPVEEHSTLLPLLASPAMLTLTAWGRSAHKMTANPVLCRAVLSAMVEVLNIYEGVLRDVAAKEAESLESEVSGAVLSDEMRRVISSAHEVYYCFAAQMHSTAAIYRKHQKKARKAGTSSDETDIIQPHLALIERMARRLEEFDAISRMGGANDLVLSHLVFADRYDYRFSTLIATGSSPSEDDITSYHKKVVELLRNVSYHTLCKSDIADVVRLCHFLKESIRRGRIERGPKLEEGLDSILNRILPGARHRRDPILASMVDGGGGGDHTSHRHPILGARKHRDSSAHPPPQRGHRNRTGEPHAPRATRTETHWPPGTRTEFHHHHRHHHHHRVARTESPRTPRPRPARRRLYKRSTGTRVDPL